MKHTIQKHSIQATDRDRRERDAARPEEGTGRGERDRMPQRARRRWDEPVHRTLPAERFE